MTHETFGKVGTMQSRNIRRVVLTSLTALLLVASASLLSVSQIDESFVTVKSASEIEFTIDKNNDPSTYAFFELFSPSSINYPLPFFYITEDAKMTMKGRATIDVSGKSAADGREALWLNGSLDNIDVGIMVNKPRMFIWSTSTNERADLIVRNFQAVGSKSAVVRTNSYGPRAIYTIESPEIWIEEFGSAQFVNGEARIELDPQYLETVTIDEKHPLKVFVQLTDEANPVIVTKGDTYFIVRESLGGKSSATFDYRLVAKRKGYEDTRLEPVRLDD